MHLPRALPAGSVDGGVMPPGANDNINNINNTSNHNFHKLSTPATIALTVIISLILLGIFSLAFYFLYWRNRGRKTTSTARVEEFEIDEDGSKIEMLKEQKKRGWWGSRRKDTVETVDTPAHVSAPPAVVVRSQE